MGKYMQGIQASNGIAIARILKFVEEEPVILKWVVDDVAMELERLHHALASTKKDITAIEERTKTEIGEEEAEIFKAHLLIIEDTEFIDAIISSIQQQFINAEFAVTAVANHLIELFTQLDDDYLKARAADIFDVKRRIISHLLHQPLFNLNEIKEEVILVAHDLTPSDTAQLNVNYVKGFVTAIGGRTSHTAIIANSLQLPAIVGVKNILQEVANDELVIIDGNKGLLIISPTEEDIFKYEQLIHTHKQERSEKLQFVTKQTLTADGKHLELAANITSPDDLAAVLKQGSEGIGLFRTEFLFMGRKSPPSEEEQFTSYKMVLEKMEGKPVVVRTFDIGGDKELPYLNLPKESNPFLGFRAIRICLAYPDLFRIQIRALLRASVYGQLKIMFPMIASVEEFRAAKAIFLEEKEKLQQEEVTVSDNIEVGMMIEIPSVAVIADILAPEVDFFSIGTNDLIQYTMAADRMNEQVAYLYQPFHPAVLRLIQMIIHAGHAQGKWVGMCGEMAGDEVAIPILIGMGIDELSISATSILSVRQLISKVDSKKMGDIVRNVLTIPTHAEIIDYIRQLHST